MSQVLNGYGFRPGAYTDQANPLEGTAGTDLKARSYANPLLNQVSQWTVAGVDTSGVHSVTIQLPDGTLLTATYTATVPPDDSTAVAAGLVNDINTSDAWANVATAQNAAGVITVTYLHAGFIYPVTGTVVQGAATITIDANPQDAGGAPMPVGRWVVAAANPVDPDVPAAALPGPGGNLVGITKRPHGQLVQTVVATNPDQADESFIASDMVPVGYSGSMYVRNAGSVASVKDAQVFAVVNTAGGNRLGESRADDDGANSEPAPGYWVDVVQPGERGRVSIQRGL